MDGNSLCGAALIAPRFVLTVAHCRDADTNFSISGIETSVADRAVHPLYDAFTYENDIVLFELEEDAMMLNPTGELVPAPYVTLSPDEIATIGASMTVIGLGDTNPVESETVFSEQLNQVDVNYVSNEECRRDHRGGITEEMMCAEAPGQDACYGDSGGPLLLTPTEDFNDDRLVGMVSWGRSCADADYPGVYTRISYFYDWIVGTMCVLNAFKVPPYVNCAEIMGLSPSESPIINEGIREEELSESPTNKLIQSEAPTISPTTTPTARSTFSLTAIPTAIPSVAPVPVTLVVPVPDDTPSCGDKNAACVGNNDCCSNRCNIFSKMCATAVGSNRNRLSLGLGGSAGAVDRTKKRTSLIDLP
jgi:trypsin